MTGDRNNNDVLKPDIVISSRVRLARNLERYPFPFRMSREQSLKLLSEIKDIVIKSSATAADNFYFVDIQKLNPVDRQVLVEKHLISPDLAESQIESAAIISKDETISIMVNEEDHIRIQCLYPGMQIDAAWQLCNNLDKLFEEKVDYAFSKDFGYLTCCPTNIGTGIRASVMLHLPALVMTGYIRNILEACSKLSIAVRGMYGENTEAAGNMFQISNQVTLGQTEQEIIANITSVASQIIEQERTIRNELYKQNPYRFEDKIYRSLGIFTNARIMTSEECMKLISDVRLGIDMGIIKTIDRNTLDKIMLLTQPANLQKTIGKPLSPEERDLRRAELIRELIKR
ncbi:MAG TPA: protein arginine kinase [Clostridiaceae bacterium]|nr:protein arginine kinase [Clostridiaceae bacterium]